MAKKGDLSGVAPGYLHGFSPREQERLYDQARFLEPSVYREVDFGRSREVLEVGCGVGAQTEILLRRFPQLRITGVDASAAQIERARAHLAGPIAEGRVTLQTGDALKLGFPDASFDGAFICWLLEHVQEPLGILREILRVLKPGGVLYCTEVLNQTFFVHPYCEAIQRYWFEANDHQWNLKGDPFVGAKLGNYLVSAGFTNVVTRPTVYHYDSREPESRAAFLRFWCALMESSAEGLISAGKVTRELVEQMKIEFDRVREDPDSVFYYTWIGARAEAPR